MTLKPKIAPHIVGIIARLQEAGYEAYIVGGAVRDFLLDRQPKDYDLSTSATPEEIKKVFKDRHCLIIGKRFRLVHLRFQDEIVEISTFRRPPREQSAYDDRPKRALNAPENMIFHDNEFGTAEEDAWRRDFTINAIFYDPVNDSLIDFTGQGLPDIQSHTIRIIGDADLRFEEDPVRLLRALKLVGQYQFSLAPETEKSLRKQLPLIVHAAPSRMTLELEKILKNPYGDKILNTFRSFGFLRYFLPALDQEFDTPQGRYAMQLLSKRNERMLGGLYRDSMSLAIALLTLPFAEKMIGNRQPGELWEYEMEIDHTLRALISKVFTPHVTTKRAAAAAMRTLLFQPRLKQTVSNARYVGMHGYAGGRELAIIQNEIVWHIDDFESRCPQPNSTKKQFSHRRRYRAKKRCVEGQNLIEKTDVADRVKQNNSDCAS